MHSTGTRGNVCWLRDRNIKEYYDHNHKFADRKIKFAVAFDTGSSTAPC